MEIHNEPIAMPAIDRVNSQPTCAAGRMAPLDLLYFLAMRMSSVASQAKLKTGYEETNIMPLSTCYSRLCGGQSTHAPWWFAVMNCKGERMK